MYTTEMPSHTVAVPAEGGSPRDSLMFDLMLRGYNRKQVDDYLGVVAMHLGELRVAAQREKRRAERAESELHTVRQQLERQSAELAEARSASKPDAASPAPEQSLGYRVEKLIRTAEHEAAEVRASAVREATALLERAKQEAESHRHEVERSLITRGVALDQEAAQRAAQLDERTAELTKNLEAAQVDSDRLVAEARVVAAQLHQDAQARIEQDRCSAEAVMRDQRTSAEGELARLHNLHTEVRGQLGRLLDSLAGEFAEPSRSRHELRPQRPHLTRTVPVPSIPGRPRLRPEPVAWFSEQPTGAMPVESATQAIPVESETQAIPTEAA